MPGHVRLVFRLVCLSALCVTADVFAPTTFSTACLACCRGEGQCDNPDEYSVACCTSPDRCCLKPGSDNEYNCCEVESVCVGTNPDLHQCVLADSSCPACCLGGSKCQGLGSAQGSCCASGSQCCQRGPLAEAGNFECCATGSVCTVIATNPVQKACTSLTRTVCPAQKTCQDCTMRGCFWTKTTCVSVCPKGVTCQYLYNSCPGGPPTSSCVRRCGNRAILAKCNCDLTCAVKKDCCPDYLQACPVPTPAPFPGPVFPVTFRFVQNDECPSSNCDCNFDSSTPTNGYFITFEAFNRCTSGNRDDEVFYQTFTTMPDGGYRALSFEDEECQTPTTGTTGIARAQLNRCVTCASPNKCKYYFLDATKGAAVTGNRAGAVLARLNFPIKWTRVFGCSDRTCSCAASGFTSDSWSVGLQGLSQCTSVVYQETLYYALVTLRTDGLYSFGTYSDEWCKELVTPVVLFDSKQVGRCQDVIPVGEGRYMVEEIGLPFPLAVQWKSEASCDFPVSWAESTGFVIETLGQCYGGSGSAQIQPRRSGSYELFLYGEGECQDPPMDGFPIALSIEDVTCQQVGDGRLRTMPKIPPFPLLLTIGNFPNGAPGDTLSMSDCVKFAASTRVALYEQTDLSEGRCVAVDNLSGGAFFLTLAFSSDTAEWQFTVYEDDGCSSQIGGPFSFTSQDVGKSCLMGPEGMNRFKVESATLPFPVRFRLITQCGTEGCKARCQNVRSPSISVGFNSTDTCVAVDSASYRISSTSNGLYAVEVFTGTFCESDPISYVFSLKDIGHCRLTGTAYFSVTSQKLDLPLEVTLQNKCKAGTICKCPIETFYPSPKVAFTFFEVCHPALNEGTGFQTYSLNFSPKGLYEVRLYKDYNCFQVDRAVFSFDAVEIMPYGKCVSATAGAGVVKTLFPQVLQPTSSPTTDPFNGPATAWALAINLPSTDLGSDSYAARNLRAYFSEKLAVSVNSVTILQTGPTNAGSGSSLLFEVFDLGLSVTQALARLGTFRYPLEGLSAYDPTWSVLFAPLGASEQMRSSFVFYQAFLAFQTSVRKTVAFAVAVSLTSANPASAALTEAQKQLGGDKQNFYCNSTLLRGANIYVLCEVLPKVNTTTYVPIVQKKFTVIGTCWPGSAIQVFRESGSDLFAEALDRVPLKPVVVALFLQNDPTDYDEYASMQVSVEIIKRVTQTFTYLLVEVQPNSVLVSGPLRLPSYPIEQQILGPTPSGDGLKLYSTKFNDFIAARAPGLIKNCEQCACDTDSYCCDRSDDHCTSLAAECMPCDLRPLCKSHSDCESNQFCSASRTCLACSIYSQADCLTFDSQCCWEVGDECSVASCEPTPAPPYMECQKCCVLPSSGESCSGLDPSEVDGSCCPKDHTCCPMVSGALGRGAWTCCAGGQDCVDGECVMSLSAPVSVGLFFPDKPFVGIEPTFAASIKKVQTEFMGLLNAGDGGKVVTKVSCANYSALSRDLGTTMLCEVKGALSSDVTGRMDEIGTEGQLPSFGATEFTVYGVGSALEFFDPYMVATGRRGCQGHPDCLATSYCSRYGDCISCSSMPLIVTNCDAFDNNCCAARDHCGKIFDNSVQCSA